MGQSEVKLEGKLDPKSDPKSLGQSEGKVMPWASNGLLLILQFSSSSLKLISTAGLIHFGLGFMFSPFLDHHLNFQKRSGIFKQTLLAYQIHKQASADGMIVIRPLWDNSSRQVEISVGRSTSTGTSKFAAAR